MDALGPKLMIGGPMNQFTGLVRYAYDRDIRFFETAESYGEPGVVARAAFIQ